MVTDAQNLFIDDYKSIQELICFPKRHETRQICAILRRWWIDGGGFIYKIGINKKVVFNISGNNVDLKIPFIEEYGGFHFHRIYSAGIQPFHQVDKKGFFKKGVLTYNGVLFSVEEIIKIISNKWGGVHFEEVISGSPNDYLRKIENDRFVQMASSITSGSEIDFVAQAVRDIALISLESLEEFFFFLTE